MISMEVNLKPDSNWNIRLHNSPLGSIHQTTEYTSYLEKVDHPKIFFLTFISEKGVIVGQLALNEYSRFVKKTLATKLLKKFPNIKKTIYRWQYGPVIFDQTYNHEILKLLYKFLISKKCKAIGFEHPLSGKNLSSLGKPFKINKWGTFLIDLTQDKDQIWNQLNKHSARKNIKRSEKRGVSIKMMTVNDLPSYYKILRETKLNVNSKIEFSSVENLWKYLHPIGLNGFLAFKNEELTGGILFSLFNNYLREWGIARTQIDTLEKLYSQDLLKWKIIEWGINNKANYYDLSGANPESTNEKESGIFRYKAKWGGKYVEYHTCSL